MIIIETLFYSGTHNVRTLIFLLVMLTTSVAHAAEDKSFRFGGQVTGASYNLKDPDGPTAPGSGYSFGGIATIDLGRGGRLWMSAARGSYTLKASVTEIGQDAATTEAGLSYQSNFRISRSFKPWFGVGIGYAASKYTNRYTSASVGSPFGIFKPDRSQKTVVGLLNANSEWPVSADLDMGIQVQAAIAPSKGANVFGLGVYLLY